MFVRGRTGLLLAGFQNLASALLAHFLHLASNCTRSILVRATLWSVSQGCSPDCIIANAFNVVLTSTLATRMSGWCANRVNYSFGAAVPPRAFAMASLLPSQRLQNRCRCCLTSALAAFIPTAWPLAHSHSTPRALESTTNENPSMLPACLCVACVTKDGALMAAQKTTVPRCRSW